MDIETLQSIEDTLPKGDTLAKLAVTAASGGVSGFFAATALLSVSLAASIRWKLALEIDQARRVLGEQKAPPPAGR